MLCYHWVTNHCGCCYYNEQNGRTALMCAAYKGHGAIVTYLVEQGANKDLKANVSIHLLRMIIMMMMMMIMMIVYMLLSWWVYVWVHVWVYVWVYMYEYVCMSIYVWVYIYEYIHISTYQFICICMWCCVITELLITVAVAITMNSMAGLLSCGLLRRAMVPLLHTWWSKEPTRILRTK